MNQSQLHTLITRYLNGEASPEEEALLVQWLDVLALKGEMPAGNLTALEKERLRRKLFHNIKERTGYSPKIKRWRRWAAAAAVALPLAVGSWLWWQRASQPAPVNVLVLRTGIGEQKMVHLGDSSRIWLAPNSELQYPETFGDNRQVTLLSGEAYFDIAHRPNQPFTVKVDSLQVAVLGTAFNIRAYQNATSLEVAVSNGKIKVMHGAEELGVLTGQQQLLVQKGSYTSRRGEISTANIESWKNNRLLFDKMPLAEVLERLENYYPVQFTAANDLRDINISGSLNLRMKPVQIMEVLEELTSNRIHFKEQQPGIYTITSN